MPIFIYKLTQERDPPLSVESSKKHLVEKQINENCHVGSPFQEEDLEKQLGHLVNKLPQSYSIKNYVQLAMSSKDNL